MAGRDVYLDEAVAEAEFATSMKDWVRNRADNIRRTVTAHDMLRYFGAKLKQPGSDREEQISCPFHGADADPSARVFPSNAKGPSALWCFVCHKRWDVLGLWKQYKNAEDERFTKTLFDIEKAFNIQAPQGPPRIDPAVAAAERAKEEVEKVYELCERRLRLTKTCFDMRGYYTLGLVLDRLRYNLDHELVPPAAAQRLMRKILDKIGEKGHQGAPSTQDSDL